MALSKQAKAIFTAVYDCVESASPAARNALSNALTEYVEKYPRTYQQISRAPFVRDLLCAMEEAADVRIGDGM